MGARQISLCLLALVLALAGCGRDPEPSRESVEVVRLGCLVPASGPLAEAGAVFREALAARVLAANREGPGGRRLELVVADQESLQSAVRELAGAQVVAVVGAFGAQAAEAAAGLLAARRIPLVFPVSGLTRLQEPTQRWVFPVRPTYTRDGRALAGYAISRLGAKHLAVIYEESDLGREGLAGIKAVVAERQGIGLTAVGIKPGQSGFGDAVRQVKETGPQAVIIYTSFVPATLIARELSRQRVEGRRLTSYFNLDPLGLELAGEAWNGMIMLRWLPEIYTVDERVQECLRGVPGVERHPSYALMGFLAGEILDGALRRVEGEVTDSRMRDALESLGFLPTAVGCTVGYSADGHRGITAVEVVRVNNGIYQTLENEWPLWVP